ncbi:conserved hypothetical protein [Altererythrobacter sp. B11]|uniref:hypothetical protein n=1 Tax=Altererythrobacter sp. B11 TaxID=2060312 RepID=UPI000DC6F6E1|nr:hypothetical protein [Altererythrobacter sp. B11]BBC73759.1 conserved hypothetical protein [Altererythrobacter sp. B11]
MRFGIGIAAAALVLGACSQESAPSDTVEEAAENIVDVAQGDPTETPHVAEGPYAPRDECVGLEGADAFRQKLAEVVKARDVDGFAALAASDIKLDFGGGGGTQELRARLSAPDSDLWSQLDKLIKLGCARNAQGGITMPWYFAQDIPGDAFSNMVVTGEDVPLLSPQTGKALRQLSWDVVALVDGLHPDAAFQQVKIGENTGYVATPMLRSVIDYRLIASSRNGKWSITSFIAGD